MPELDKTFVQTFFVELFIAALISLGGVSTLIPNIVEGIGEIVELGNYKALKTFSIFYFLIPIFGFTTFWMFWGQSILANTFIKYYNHQFDLKKNYSISEIPRFNDNSYDYSEFAKSLITALKLIPILAFLSSQFLVNEYVLMICAVAAVLLQLIITFQNLRLYPKLDDFPYLTNSIVISAMVFSLDLLYGYGLILYIKPWVSYSSDLFYVFQVYFLIGAILIFLTTVELIKRLHDPNKVNVNKSEVSKASYYLLIFLAVAALLVTFSFHLNRPNNTSEIGWIFPILLILMLWKFWRLQELTVYRVQVFRNFIIALGATVLLISHANDIFYSDGIFSPLKSIQINFYKDRHAVAKLMPQEKFVISKKVDDLKEAWGLAKCTDAASVVLTNQFKEKTIHAGHLVHKLNEDVHDQSLDILHKLRTEGITEKIPQFFYKKYFEDSASFELSQGHELLAALRKTANKTYSYIQDSLINGHYKELEEYRDFQDHWVYLHPVNFYGYYLKQYKNDYINADKAEKKVLEIRRMLLLADGNREYYTDLYNQHLKSEIEKFLDQSNWSGRNYIGEEDSIGFLIEKHPNYRKRIAERIEGLFGEREDSYDSLDVLKKYRLKNQLSNSLQDEKDLFENDAFHKYITVKHSELAAYHERISGYFNDRISRRPMDSLIKHYDESAELYRLVDYMKGNLLSNSLTLNTINGLTTFHRNYTSYKEKQYRERYKNAQKVFRSYLFETKLTGIFLYIATLTLLIMTMFFLSRFLRAIKLAYGIESQVQNSIKTVLNASIFGAALILIPLLKPVKPENIDPEKSYWMMTLKNWYIPGLGKSEFYPLDQEEEKANDDDLFFSGMESNRDVLMEILGQSAKTNQRLYPVYEHYK